MYNFIEICSALCLHITIYINKNNKTILCGTNDCRTSIWTKHTDIHVILLYILCVYEYIGAQVYNSFARINATYVKVNSMRVEMWLIIDRRIKLCAFEGVAKCTFNFVPNMENIIHEFRSHSIYYIKVFLNFARFLKEAQF